MNVGPCARLLNDRITTLQIVNGPE